MVSFLWFEVETDGKNDRQNDRRAKSGKSSEGEDVEVFFGYGEGILGSQCLKYGEDGTKRRKHGDEVQIIVLPANGQNKRSHKGCNPEQADEPPETQGEPKFAGSLQIESAGENQKGGEEKGGQVGLDGEEETVRHGLRKKNSVDCADHCSEQKREPGSTAFVRTHGDGGESESIGPLDAFEMKVAVRAAGVDQSEDAKN